MSTTSTTYHVRWMIRRDMPAVLEIENAACRWTWCEDTILDHLRQRNVIGMVAERIDDDKVLGHMVYAMQKSRLDLLRLAVHPEHWGKGVGTALTTKAKSKLSPQRRCELRVDVDERDLPLQTWLRGQGFFAHVAEAKGQTVYRFRYEI